MLIYKKKDRQDMKAIVLGANYQYADQVLTTMKSVCYHNRDIRFYVINSDFPTEWFTNLNRKLKALNCEVVNARVNNSHISQYKTNIHYATFLRYFISDFVVEDKVLYLDCDLVVTQDLTPLFEMDLGDRPLAAVKDLGAQAYFGEHSFNAGVLLINNHLWKKEEIRKQLIEMTNELHDKVAQDDQSILNILFEGRWFPLDLKYNTITIHTHLTTECPEEGYYPAIIHYLTDKKPWKMFERSIYRDVWWFYNGLEWSDMRLVHPDLRQSEVQSLKKESHSAFIYTFSLALEQIEYLIQQLPEVHFYIAAPVMVADSVTAYLAYENVSVMSDIAGQPALIDDMLDRCDFLLDINYDVEVDGIVGRFREQGKPVFAFDTVVHGDQGQLVFSAKEPADMVASIQTFCQTGEVPEKKSEADGWNFVVKDISESLDFILEHHSSVARYGDGEMDIMMGHSIPYQDYDEDLAQELKHIVALQSDEQLLVCLSDVFAGLERYRPETIAFWQGHLEQYKEAYREWCKADWYGSTFISRPYMDQLDKSVSVGYFDKLKKLWENRDILIVEGVTSRSGVGNDLFAGARRIQRIICPSRNAYQQRELIQETVEKYGQDKLILLMLGPTAKVIAYHLSQKGYQAIDIGHIDSEYEWFKMGATEKVKLSHKHTAEHNFDQDIEFVDDEVYETQIIVDLNIEPK